MTASQMYDVEINIGEPILYDGGRLIPFSRSRVFRCRWPRAVLIWNRPAAVLVKKGDGEEQVIPIVDVTRRWQVGLLGGSLVAALFIWLGMRKRLL
jgi:hypothetical protein